MSRSLTSAELREIGESNFKLFCDRAGLVCNKSSRDVTGWDFLVEFPLSASGDGVLLDQRSKTTCHVQLKTTFGGGESRISVRLSAAELLAKNIAPAMIVVFLLRPSGDGITGYLIHLLDEELAQILKLLRSAQANQKLAINRASITFDYRSRGTQFEFTPEGLRGALVAACGVDPAQYAVKSSAN